MSRLLLVLLAWTPVVGCTRDNPEFMLGDGDATDGDPVDVPACADGSTIVVLRPAADTFLQRGPTEGGTCQVDKSEGAWTAGPAGVPCSELNFGSTPVHWVSSSNAGTSIWIARFGLADYAGTSVLGAALGVGLPYGPYGDAEMRLFEIQPELGGWSAGQGDGAVAAEGEASWTYAERPEPWLATLPEGLLAGGLLAAVPLTPGAGSAQLELPLDVVTGWLEAPDATGGLAVVSDAPPGELGMAAAEAPERAGLQLDLCWE